MSTTSKPSSSASFMNAVSFRTAKASDIPSCLAIEESSYPSDEAASFSSLKYRQENAMPYFRCAMIPNDDAAADDDDDGYTIIGFVCATRCNAFTHDTMTTHDPSGSLLAIHSVVVKQEYRRQGIATKMLQDYTETIESSNNNNENDGIDTIVLLAKSHLLGFYVQAGFSVLRPSDIVHGQELWYHLERTVKKKKQPLLPSSPLPCWTVDSFAQMAGQGNPAGVVLLPHKTNDVSWMKTVAKEYNLSETTFIWPLGGGGDNDDKSNNNDIKVVRYRIRFFTPDGTEVDLCGHATLAAAAVLFEQQQQQQQQQEEESAVESIVFSANKDELRAFLAAKQDPKDSTKAATATTTKQMMISMDFPRKQLHEVTETDPVLDMMYAAFPHISQDMFREGIVYIGLDQDGNDLFIELVPHVFEQLGFSGIRFEAFLSYHGYSRGIILCTTTTSQHDENNKEEVDFLSRFFGPKAGINEDPVTGSAHCTLAPYFAAKLGKETIVGHQTSMRGGIVKCLVSENRVTIIGTAITTMSGNLLVYPDE